MKFNVAILSVLAAKPEERVAVDEVSREVKRMIAAGDPATQLDRLSEIGDTDVFQAGWVSINDAGMQITNEGLSLWRSLNTPRAVTAPGEIDLDIPDMIDDRRHDHGESESSGSGEAPDGGSRDTPVFPDPAFGSAPRASRSDSRLAALLGVIRTGMPRLARGRRRSAANAWEQKSEPVFARMTGLALACLSLIAVVACITAAIALGQISSLKSDIAALRREQAPLTERLARLEQAESARRDAEQEEDAQDRREPSKNGIEQSALSLSRDEIQLIREYIKAAPSASGSPVAINVGDSISGGMIPLPSSLTEKVPRLVGARFATRNGTIILSLRNSHRVDAVLPPN
ncbi:hypothetical protein [Bradyrhizobium macuxiense]|nr:hypothetical protein [Bradyrhizobium macuxiense]